MDYELFFDIRKSAQGDQFYPTIVATDGSKLVSNTGFYSIAHATAFKSGFDLCQSIEDVGGFEMMQEEVRAKEDEEENPSQEPEFAGAQPGRSKVPAA